MPGFVVHIAIAQEYLKKQNKEFSEDFILGSISPDFTDNKSQTHYGKSPAYTNLDSFLKSNEINSDFQQGYFLHLVTDYLFYNYYVENFAKPQIYYDYDFTNEFLIQKYNVILPEQVKDKVFFKQGEPQILTLPFACKFIDEVSSLSLEEIKKQVEQNNPKWNYYKNLI